MPPEKFFRNDDTRPRQQRRDKDGFPIEENHNRSDIPPMEKKPNPADTIRAVHSVMKMLGVTEGLTTNQGEKQAANMELKNTVGAAIREVVESEKKQQPRKVVIPTRKSAPPQHQQRQAPQKPQYDEPEDTAGRTFDIPDDFDPSVQGFDFEAPEFEEFEQPAPRQNVPARPADKQMELDFGDAPNKMMEEICYHSEKLKEINQQMKVLSSIDATLKEILEILKKEGGTFRPNSKT